MHKGHPKKLTAENEQAALRLLDEGLRVNVVAERFSVGGSTIGRIKKKYGLTRTLTAASKAKRRHHRKINALERQFLWHLWDLRAKQPTSLAQLARKFRTSVEEIQEAIAARKKLCPTPYSHWQTESESET